MYVFTTVYRHCEAIAQGRRKLKLNGGGGGGGGGGLKFDTIMI